MFGLPLSHSLSSFHGLLFSLGRSLAPPPSPGASRPYENWKRMIMIAISFLPKHRRRPSLLPEQEFPERNKMCVHRANGDVRHRA
jgi:hypothetical protein